VSDESDRQEENAWSGLLDWLKACGSEVITTRPSRRGREFRAMPCADRAARDHPALTPNPETTHERGYATHTLSRNMELFLRSGWIVGNLERCSTGCRSRRGLSDRKACGRCGLRDEPTAGDLR
jgi:hypothetical protein